MLDETKDDQGWAFEYGRLKEINRDYFKFSKTGYITVESISEAVIAYSWNMERIGYLATLVTDAIFFTTVSNRLAGPTVPIRTGRPVVDIELARPEDVDAPRRYLEAFNAYISKLSDVSPRYFQERRWEIGTNVLGAGKFNSSVRDRPVGHGIEALFCSMILGAYAALETLAGDLWIATINLNPDLIPASKDNRDPRLIDFRDLKEFGFDVRGKVGQFLHYAGKVNFQSYGSILAAYEMAFSKRSKEYSVLVSDPELRKSEKVRHLIAHKGGRVDQQFLNETSSWPDFADVQLNKHLPLTGGRVCELINPCVRTAVGLIESINTRTSRYTNRVSPNDGLPVTESGTNLS